jgi:sugar lactone lactonase YvrE
MKHYRAEPLSSDRMDLGEGALWDDALERWLWVDITQGAVYEANLGGCILKRYVVPDVASTVALTESGDLIVTGQRTLYHVSRKEGNAHALFDVPGIPNNQRLNDGKPDPDGRLIAGAMVTDGGDSSAKLYSVSMNGTASALLTGLGCSNGIGFSPCGNFLYHIDTPQKKVHRYRYDVESGTIRDQTVVVNTSAYDGVPDGMTTDGDGLLYVAMWGGSTVLIFEAEHGTLVGQIDLPTSYVTSCAFGGASLKQLLITTASQQDEHENPCAGLCYQADINARGMRPDRIQGL